MWYTSEETHTQDETTIEAGIYNLDTNSFPIYSELVLLMRTIESMDDITLASLKTVLTQIISIEAGEEVKLNKCLTSQVLTYLEILLKLHQVLALVDVDFTKLVTDRKVHVEEIIQQLTQKGGLNYVPRERTPKGRLLDHAADTKTLIHYLLQTDLEIGENTLTQKLFYVSTSPDSNLKEKIFLQIQRDYVELVLSSNGKVELYFHGYLWTKYFQMITQDLPNVSPCKEIQRMANLGNRIELAIEKIKNNPFSEAEYQCFIKEFASLKPINRSKMITQIQCFLFMAQLTNNQDSLYLIEKLLIQLLGYPNINCRDNAVLLLNSLYDGTDWQMKAAFRPVIRCIGQHFKVNLTIQLPNYTTGQHHIFLALSAPSPHSGVNDTIITWHKIEQRNIVQTNQCETEIAINFGKFWKCGFYDWRLVQMLDLGKLNTLMLTKPPTIHNFPLSIFQQQDEIDNQYNVDRFVAQGRFIVQAKGLRDESFHEVQVDNQNAKIDLAQQRFIKRGTFKDIENSLPEYKNSGVSVLYLMGAFQRDNCPVKGSAKDAFYNQGSIQMMRKENAPPLAVTNRQTPCEMLGGKPGFYNMMLAAKKENIKIIVDCLARISSSRHDRKYRDLLLHYLDIEGRRHICYGTDGHATKYEDTTMLNYRKIESWELLIEEVISYATEMRVDGIHLDNGQAWPQIFEPDLEELTRKDDDGLPAYSAQQIMDGEIVIRNENYGYWNTNSMEYHANPFFIKLCKRLWSKFPNFIIVGECWGGFKFEHRQIILARSGIIPRLFKLPQAICSIFGTTLHRDGRVTKNESKESVVAIQNWYQESQHQVPEGTILIQSSASNSWPYPAYLYGRGAWAAVDILYFMPDIPITFNREVDGEIYRLGHGSVHQAELQATKSGNEIKKTNSQVRLALDQSDGDSEQELISNSPQRIYGDMPRIRSGHNLAAVQIELSSNPDEMKKKELKFKQEVGPDFGFDLNKIRSHYEHRRFLRQSKMVLRYGQMCFLSARKLENTPNQDSWLPNVLVFARYSLMETAIVAINLSEKEQTFYIDFEQLKKLYIQTFDNNNAVVVTSSLLPALNQSATNQTYFFLREYTSSQHVQTLNPFGTSIQIITVCREDKDIFKQTLKHSIERTTDKLIRGKDIEADQISLLLLDCLQKKTSDGAYFAGLVTCLQESFLDQINMTFSDLVLRNRKLTSDPILFAKLFALCTSVQNSNTKASISCRSLIETNQLGPIVFCTPELGKWSTVGGLGVMVDELSIGLAKEGQDVIVISPYYERNRAGKTGYLAEDPANIKYVDNISVQADLLYTIGVHEGVVGKVKVVFLHHSDIFPIPYAEINASMSVRQIAVFSKACLEYCCKRQIIPSMCVTNDWFTGFVAAYAKVGAFGPTFKGTTFMHICHNLMEDYEGRIYPEPRDGFLQHIHQLPKDWLIDPSWGKNMINPSRTAIMLSDQWSTVSKSYLDDLLKNSPLSPLLKQKSNPFAFPNGIPINDRLRKLDAAAPDHLEAKRLIQNKYFNFFELDDSIPLLAFVGRITNQKGVHLILEIAEEIILKYKYKVQFLVGGAANMRDPYSASCANKMRYLKSRYPHCFWAAPEEFFTDGSLINRGADFGLMPSLFEPGGIVQHEFFVGGTPVIAYKTGGLKDSVIEFQWDTEVGCGFTFECYKREDFVFACQRALGVFNQKTKYQKLRINAFDATMAGEIMCKAWLQEFYRLRQKVYFDKEEMTKNLGLIKPWSVTPSLNIFDQMFGSAFSKMYGLEDIDFGAEDENKENQRIVSSGQVVSEFDKMQRERISKTFMLHNRGPLHFKVQVCGSFDNWEKRHQMQFDHITNQWFVTLQLPKGEFFYKYVINEKQWVLNEEERQTKDKLGNLNNFISL